MISLTFQMIRLKSIDNFRGITIIAMIWLHLSEWWLSGDSRWFLNSTILVTQYVFWVSFQFISGISSFLFYKRRKMKIEASKSNKKKKVKREFILRALLLLIVSLIYNSMIAIAIMNPLYIWSSFILLSIATSLIMVWPLLETSKWTRLYLGIIFMVFNFIFLSFLQGFKGQVNLFGIVYHFLYYPISLHPIFSSFAAFLIGTVFGDIIYDIYINEDKGRRRRLLKRRIIIPSFIIGGILITFVYSAESVRFLNLDSFYRIISSMGISLILFSIFVLIEEYEILKTKRNYNFIFYFSYYSLTIYLVHNLLFFLFFEMLDALASLFYIVIVIVLIGLFLKLIYPKFGASISIKKMMSKLSYKIVIKLEEKEVLDELE